MFQCYNSGMDAAITKPQSKWIVPILGAAAFAISLWFVYSFLPVHAEATPPATWGFAVDWKGCIRPDTLKLLSGHSPYAEGCGLNPPWAYLLLAPIAVLPPALGAAIVFVLTYFVYLFVLHRLGAKPWMLAAFLLCYFPFQNAMNGNIDWLVVLGFVLPPPAALFFLVIKPQIGAGLALFYLVEAWRKGGILRVVWDFGPVTVAFLLSFAVFGLWPLQLARMPADAYNRSLWPYGLLFGVPLLVYALAKRQKLTAAASTPLLAPYINIHSFAVSLFAFLPNPPAFLLAIALSWLAR